MLEWYFQTLALTILNLTLCLGFCTYRFKLLMFLSVLRACLFHFVYNAFWGLPGLKLDQKQEEDGL